jgi:hypothetical protein
MLNTRYIDLFVKFCILGSMVGLALVVYGSSGQLSSSVRESSQGIEDEIRSLKESLNITRLQVVLDDIQRVLVFISEATNNHIKLP